MELTKNLVYFLYPETTGVRLEDMDAIFGDATTTAPTPITQAERGSLRGLGSPVPSLDIRRRHDAGDAIPGLDIDPPVLETSQVSSNERPSSGVSGWLSRLLRRGNSNRGSSSNSGNGRSGGQYKPINAREEDE